MFCVLNYKHSIFVKNKIDNSDYKSVFSIFKYNKNY